MDFGNATRSTLIGARGSMLIAAALLFFAPQSSWARDFYVSVTGNDANLGTQTSPYKTIKKAVGLARAGDTVYVTPGTYPGNFEITADGTANSRIRVLSTKKWGAKIVPNGTAQVLVNMKGDYITVDGFEIDGQSNSAVFHGIMSSGSYHMISNNHIHHFANHTSQCISGKSGSAINSHYYLFGAHNDIINNVVHHIGPPREYGCLWIHGIYMSTSGSVKNNISYANGFSGLAMSHDVSNVDVSNNILYLNQTGIHMSGTGYINSTTLKMDYMNVSNNIAVNNTLYGIRNTHSHGFNNTYTNNLVFNNGKANLSLINATAVGTVVADPQFVNPAAFDFRLKSTSPAIDKGSMKYALPTDILGVRRPQGAAVDIGSYEYVAAVVNPTPTPVPSSPASVDLVVTGNPSMGPYSVEAKTTVTGDISVQFFDNGILMKLEQAAPYCLTGQTGTPVRCATRTLGPGTHNLVAKVIAAVGGKVLAQTSRIIIEGSNSSPSPTATPLATPRPTATPTATPIPTPAPAGNTGKVYFISPTGSDSNPGTRAAPWKTFCKADSVVQPGDSVRALSGTYEINTAASCGWGAAIFLRKSGTMTAPIIYISDVKWGAKIRSSKQSAAVRLYGNYITFSHFDVSIGATEPAYPNGVLFAGIHATGTGTRVLGNRVHDLPNDFGCANFGGGGVISAMSDKSNPTATVSQEISNNIVFNVGTAPNCSASKGTIHGIYGQTVGIRVRNNIVFKNRGGYGIYLNHCHTKAEIVNNLLWGNGSAAIALGSNVDTGCAANTGTVVNNNIIRDSKPSGSWGLIRNRPGTGNNTASNNMFFNTTGAKTNGFTETGSITADPRMVDFKLDGGGDYRLRGSSPAIDKGTSTKAPYFDFDLQPRPRGLGYDIGPFEY